MLDWYLVFKLGLALAQTDKSKFVVQLGCYKYTAKVRARCMAGRRCPGEQVATTHTCATMMLRPVVLGASGQAWGPRRRNALTLLASTQAQTCRKGRERAERDTTRSKRSNSRETGKKKGFTCFRPGPILLSNRKVQVFKLPTSNMLMRLFF